MTNQQLKEKVLSWVPDAEIIEGKQFLTVTVRPDKLFSLARNLKDDRETSFDYLFCLTGVDNVKNLGVVYHIRSTTIAHSIVLKTSTVDRNKPVLPSVYDVWKAAEYHEREVYDMLGIEFTNHPDLRRIFLWEAWEGYPLRKDYVDDKIIERK